MRFALAFVLALAITACHSDPQPAHPAPGEVPPLRRLQARRSAI